MGLVNREHALPHPELSGSGSGFEFQLNPLGHACALRMGVDGLWELLAACARRQEPDALAGQTVAVDASLWLIQFLKAMRDQDGRAGKQVHLQGMLARLCKLLFHGIKPVFVFDGPAPALKRKTLARRRESRFKASQDGERLAKKILLTRMKVAGIEELKQVLEKQALAEDRREERLALPRPLVISKQSSIPVDVGHLQESVEEQDELVKPIESSSEEDSDFAELPQLDELDESTLANLPYSMQFEIIQRGKLELRRGWRRKYIQAVESNKVDDFSSLQLQNFLHASQINRRLEKYRDSYLSQVSTETTGDASLVARPIASLPDRHFVLDKRTQKSKHSDKNRKLKQEEPKKPKVPTVFRDWKCNFCSTENISACMKCQTCNRNKNESSRSVVYLEHEKLKRERQESMRLSTSSSTKLDSGNIHALNDIFGEEDSTEKLDSSGSIFQDWLCSYCKASNRHHDSVCQFCSREIAPFAWKCHHCQSVNLKSSAFCVVCSSDANNLESPVQPKDSDPAGESKTTDPNPIAHSLASFAKDISSLRNSRQNFYQLSKTLSAQPSREESEDSVEQNMDRAPEIDLTDDLSEETRDFVVTFPSTELVSSETDKGVQARPPSKESPSRALEGRVDDLTVIEANLVSSDAIEIPQNERIPKSEAPMESASSCNSFVSSSTQRVFPNVSNPPSSMPKPRSEIEAFSRSQPDVLRWEDFVAIGNDPGSELEDLRHSYAKTQRDSDVVTPEMITEVHELLRLFGIPYIVAPGEAEAQCAFLNRAGLVDAVVTVDSDVFLFGAKTVYRNLFDPKKYVEKYETAEFQRSLGLSREDLVFLALLLGSDYTEGIVGIGIVNAIEILSVYPHLSDLKEFKDWCFANSIETQPVLPSDPSPEQQKEYDLKSFKFKHRKIRRNWEIPDSFPEQNVIDAYLKPNVDNSLEPFEWGLPDIPNLTLFCRSRLGIEAEQLKERLDMVMKHQVSTTKQTRLDKYFVMPEKVAEIRSQRLQKAVSGLKRKREN